MRGFRYIEQDVTLRLDETSCTACGICTQVCPHGVLEVVDKRARISDLGACMECGACAKNCAFGALTVRQGVGCASAVISSWFHRRNEPSCGDDDASSGSSCC